MFCPNCGAQNPDGTVFCANCGTKMAAEQPAAQPAFQQPVYQQPVYQQPVYQQPVYQQPVAPVAPDAPMPGKALGIVGMVLGIISLVFCWLWYIGLPFSIPAFILCCIAKGKANKAGRSNGMATAGFVCSLISLILNTVLFVIIVLVVGILMA